MSTIDKWNLTSNNLHYSSETIEENYYINEDASVIYDALKNHLKPVSFGFYLHRYVNRLLTGENSDNTTNAAKEPEYSFDDCRDAIIQSFTDTRTPFSFTPTSARVKQTVKNWMTQDSVNRNVVILLGFGLKMPLEDVQDFFQKGLQQQGLNSKSPLEATAYYCFKKKYTYYAFSNLIEEYKNLEPNPETTVHVDMNFETQRFTNELDQCNTDAELMAYLAKLKTADNKSKFSVTIKKNFDELYKVVLQDIADMKNATTEYRKTRFWTTDDLSEADVENVISAAIPLDEKGNRVKSKLANIDIQIAEKRITKQKFNSILNGKISADRFDLISLKFLSYALKRSTVTRPSLDDYTPSAEEYTDFINETNKILTDCNLAPLYPGNMYECLILMCTLTEDPLCSYNDVFGEAYGETFNYSEKDPFVLDLD